MSDPQESSFGEKTRSLIQFSLDALPGMYCSDRGLFCNYRTIDQQRVGVSVRYTLICLLGLYQADKAGYGSPFDLDALYEQAHKEVEAKIADMGLLLWAGSLIGRTENEDVYQKLAIQLERDDLAQLTGMELGLALTGLLAYARSQNIKEAFSSAERLKNLIVERCLDRASGLFFHTAGAALRRKYPNFATQIYLMYGLARYALYTEDREAAKVATGCADHLCELQRSDGGWPWIYHATSGRVVEDYEIYSVHQDGMMPMALLEVGEANSKVYREAIQKGLQWLYGENELKTSMVDA